jgi:hypothetical protein
VIFLTNGQLFKLIANFSKDEVAQNGSSLGNFLLMQHLTFSLNLPVSNINEGIL